MSQTNIKQKYRKLFRDRENDKTPSHPQLSPPNLPLLAKQPSIRSLSKIKNHYSEFQHALNMLKASVEELWRLELEQLQNHQSTPVDISNITFNLKVPSIYTCRAVLPMASETVHLENEDASNVHSPMSSPVTPVASIQDAHSNKMNTQENMLPSNSQTTSSKWKTAQSLLSPNKNQRQSGSSKTFTKYCRKTALLHLKVRCLKRVH